MKYEMFINPCFTAFNLQSQFSLKQVLDMFLFTSSDDVIFLKIL